MKSIGCFEKCGKCGEGIWVDEDRPYFKRWLDKYQKIRSIFTIDKWRKKVSTVQGGYFHGVIVKKFSEKTGMMPEEAKYHLKEQFLKVDRVGLDGKIRVTVRSYASLSTMEAEEFHEKCRIYILQEVGQYVPLPNEPDRSM
ncbi:hypothetical protein [Leptospira phage LE3]|uniref:Uncharacterized protein n=2 Tax=Nylescharonvirus TaxID=2843431 RepID=A0A343LEH4_9CAUD|nr:hypothetical protein HWB33_gp73 [Leptospira phage LE3]YP_009835546.1 hypothetical protein HWB34_gp71 [Leptospira phage LE4]ATN95004.1 hypothetical protein [Leptospira phage LE3]ATN95084.1 hypothetical protein [Leptospira phage LE4]